MRDIVRVDIAFLCKDNSGKQCDHEVSSKTIDRKVYTPCAEKMAANTGRASSKVIEGRAMKACRKARLLSLYSVSLMLLGFCRTPPLAGASKLVALQIDWRQKDEGDANGRAARGVPRPAE